MNIIPTFPVPTDEVAVPLLVNGDRMTQPEFHERYTAHTGAEKFELIGGMVFMASPLRYLHGLYHEELSFILGLYRRATPGVEVVPEATAILGKTSEPRPDLLLRIAAECGGRSRINEEEYLEGPPELIAEIAYSSRAIDLHQKRDDYRRAGVQEYLVFSIEEQQLYWFDFAADGEINPDRKGTSRSRVFPGLWLHAHGLAKRDSEQLADVVQNGIASRAHASFVRRLQRARRSGG